MSYICKICGKPIGIKLAMGKGRTTTSCPNYDKMPPCDKSEDGKHKVKKTAGELPYEYLFNLFEFSADDVNETVFWFNSDSKRMEL